MHNMLGAPVAWSCWNPPDLLLDKFDSAAVCCS